MAMCISIAQARTRWAARFAPFRRCRFTSVPCSFFELCPCRVAGVGHPGHYWIWLKSKTAFCVTGAGHGTIFHPCGRRGTFWTLLHKTLAGVGQNERCLLEAIGQQFERVENRVLWNRRVESDFGQWWCFRLADAALRMPQAQYFVDLDKKVAET